MSLPPLEIGTEEILIDDPRCAHSASFEKLNLPHGNLRVDATPRRLTLRADNLLPSSPMPKNACRA